MLRYKTETRPGLVTLYDIQPGNEVGQFLQPKSLHGAQGSWCYRTVTTKLNANTTFPPAQSHEVPQPNHNHNPNLNAKWSSLPT